MSRLYRIGHGARSIARRVNAAGVARVVIAAGGASALVYLAATRPVDLDLVAAAGEDEVTVGGTALTTRVDASCPGPELTGIPGLPDVTVKGWATAAAGPADLLPVPASGDGSLLMATGAGTLLTVDARPGARGAALPRDGAVRLTGTGALAPAIAGAQEWRLDDKDLRGLATTPCAPGGSDLWLLGGGADPGRQERLVLANPGGNPVTADVTVHGALGPVGEPVVETVPPGGRVSLLLDARSPDEERPAVHVRASGGGLHATLTDTWVLGSTALGAETSAPTAVPATAQVVPGASLGSGPATLRVAVPGDQDAVVRVSVLGRDGLVPLSGSTVLSVAAGAVGDLPLAAVPEGTYAVEVRSDVPVVASVLSRVGDGTAPGEFAWSVSADAIRSLGGAALPTLSGVSRTLHLVGTGASAVEVVTVVDGAPVTRRIDLRSGRVTTVPLDGATSVWVQRVDGSGDVRGTVLSSSGTGPERMLSSMPLEESAVTSPVSRAFPLP
jgi:hypothetical protein